MQKKLSLVVAVAVCVLSLSSGCAGVMFDMAARAGISTFANQVAGQAINNVVFP